MKKKQLAWHDSQTSCESGESSQITIMNHDNVSNSSMPIYNMPLLNSQPTIIFYPDEWSLDRFEVGRPLGTGKYPLSLGIGSDTSTLLASEVASS